MLRTVLIVCLLGLCACAGHAPMQQLEAEALQSGDWTAVHQRERMIARQRGKTDLCPDGEMAVCTRNVGADRCRCTNRAGFRRLVSGSFW